MARKEPPLKKAKTSKSNANASSKQSDETNKAAWIEVLTKTQIITSATLLDPDWDDDDDADEKEARRRSSHTLR